MVDQARLRSVDEELDGFGIDSARLEAVRARAITSRLSLTAVDEALGSLAGRFETQVPEGVVARPASWSRASEPAPREIPEDASGLVEVDERVLAAAPLPAVLSDVPPPLDASSAVDDGADRPSVEIFVEVGAEPVEEAEREAAADARPGTDPAPAGVPDELAASGPEVAPTPSALELELEPAPPMEVAPPRSASFAPPRDSVHPRPGSVVPPPPSADLDAELASILAEELAGREPEPTDDDADFEPEPTALFSADMFGATEEPSLAQLVSQPPPAGADVADLADLEGEEDSLEIDIDEDAMIVDAAPAPAAPVMASRLPPQGTRPPPPPSKSMPPEAGKPGFLGRLLNRK